MRGRGDVASRLRLLLPLPKPREAADGCACFNVQQYAEQGFLGKAVDVMERPEVVCLWRGGQQGECGRMCESPRQGLHRLLYSSIKAGRCSSHAHHLYVYATAMCLSHFMHSSAICQSLINLDSHPGACAFHHAP